MSRSPAMSLVQSLLPASKLAQVSARVPHWRPGFSGTYHSEVFAPAAEASGAAAALALAADALRAARPGPAVEMEDRRALLWVQDHAALKVGGRPYRLGLPPTFRHRLIHVVCEKPEDALFALEEGLRCRDVSAVIGEVAGNPKAFDFTASRRLTLTAERHGVPLWLVRLDASHDLSSARMRWEVRAAPSPPPRWNQAAPGNPAWHAELFRARQHPPGTWTLRDDGTVLSAARVTNDDVTDDDIAAGETATPHPLGLAFAAGDRSLAAG